VTRGGFRQRNFEFIITLQEFEKKNNLAVLKTWGNFGEFKIQESCMRSPKLILYV
jgi:hypothetical protein